MKTQERTERCGGCFVPRRRILPWPVWLLACCVAGSNLVGPPARAETRGYIPDNEDPACDPIWNNCVSYYYVQPTIRRVDTRNTCEGVWCKAGVYRPFRDCYGYGKTCHTGPKTSVV